MNVNSLISCIIPTYRRTSKLDRAIGSVLQQTYKNIELLIVDDNQPGDEFSVEVNNIIKRYDDKRIKYCPQTKHKNGAAARNLGIKLASGDYIAFLDDDDEWKEDKLEKQMHALEKDKEASICSCLIEEYQDGSFIRKRPYYNTEHLQYRVLKRDVSVGTPTLLIKKDLLLEIGGFDEDLKRNQEIQLLAFLLQKGKLILVNEYLVICHISIGQDSNNPNVKEIEKIKLDFLNSVAPILSTYSTKEKKLIIAANYFEIIYVALKAKNIILASKYLIKIGPNTAAFVELYERYRRKFLDK